MKKNRPDWDQYFMKMAHLVEERSTCLRRKVGAIIVKDKRILSTGYNGSPKGCYHCEETGCLREKMNIPSGERHEICRAVHAEQNAIIQAAYFGTPIADSIMYSTVAPCFICAKMIVNAGIKKVYIDTDYPDQLALNIFKEAKVEIIKIKTNERG